MNFREMTEADIEKVIPLYLDWYNGHEEGCWTGETACKRIHQVWSMEGGYCLLLEEDGLPLGFVMGYFHPYDDLVAYDLEEIVIAAHRQGQGLGTALMTELERRVKARGAGMIQLEAVSDEMHEHFYAKLGFYTAKSLTLKGKQI